MKTRVWGVGLAILLTPGLIAARPSTSEWHVNQFTQQQPVEQQTPGGATQPDETLWVVNPTTCVWDSDDYLAARWTGRVERGDAQSLTVCVVGDWSEHLFRISASEGLVTTISASDGPDASSCLRGPNYDSDPDNPALVSIPESNGGVGHIHQITFTARNLGKKPLAHASISVEISIDAPAFVARCPILTRLSGEPDWSVG